VRRLVVALLLLVAVRGVGYLRTTGHDNLVEWYRHPPASQPVLLDP